MKKNALPRILLLIIFLSALLRIGGGIVFLNDIPKSYGWYHIAVNVLTGQKTLLPAGYSVDNGRELLHTKYYLVRPPLYILFYVMIIHFFNGSLFFYLLFHSLISGVTIFLAFTLLRRFLSEKVAYLGSVIVAFYPYFVTRVWNATEDNLYIMFILIFLLLIFVYFDSQRYGILALAGLTLGATYLVRSTILFFVIFIVPLVVIREKKRRIAAAAILLITFTIPIIPWIFYGHSIYGHFVVADHNGSRLWISNNPYILQMYPRTSIDRIEERMWNGLSYEDYISLASKGQLERENKLQHKAIQFITKNPWKFIRGGLKKAFCALSLSYNPTNEEKNMKLRNIIHNLCYLPLLLFGILGIILYGKKYKIQSLVFILFSLSLAAMSFLFWAHTRHTIPYHLTYIFGLLILIEENKEFWIFRCFRM